MAAKHVLHIVGAGRLRALVVCLAGGASLALATAQSATPSPTPSPAPTPPADSAAPSAEAPPPSLEETRLALAKWIETQQIISRERNEWQQGKDVLQARIDLVGKEVSQLKERIAEAQKAVAESNKKRDALVAENDALKAVAATLTQTVAGMENQVRALAKQAPQPIAERLAPLLQRLPSESNPSRMSAAERFQNVLGILNELNKANSEITVAYEIRNLADGSSSEVQVIYVGLAQAYYISPRGEAGVGQPSADGWTWKPAPEAANAILTTLEVIEGKRPPAFTPLPVAIQ